MRATALLATALLIGGCGPQEHGADVRLMDFDAPTLAAAIASGEVGAEQAVRAALARIAALDDSGPQLNAIIEVNPDALEIARTLDIRFAAAGPVGPLHGVPVVLKANIDTGDRMATSAGSIALRNHHAAEDADLVARLRAAGAVIVAKSNLSEFANFRSLVSSSGWSSLGGQTKNPYVLELNPCGSSSGSAVAVAARMVPLAVGTETDGSIVCPAAVNGIVGIKPTLGRVSQNGIIPIAASQDTAGPMARTVAGAAMLLDVLRVDGGRLISAPNSSLDLNGIRIGVWREFSGAGSHAGVEAAFAAWLGSLAEAGAALIDPIPLKLPDKLGSNEFEVLLYEFKAGIGHYLEGVHDGPQSLEAVIAYNEANAELAMPYFGQDVLRMASERTDLASPVYRSALAHSRDDLRTVLADTFDAFDLDAIIAPANGPAWPTNLVDGDDFSLSSSSLAAVSGYPSIVVPGGLVDGLPIGLAFIGQWNEDEALIDIASVFESVRPPLPAPAFAVSR